MVGPMILINKGQLATLVMHARGSLLQNVLFLFYFVLFCFRNHCLWWIASTFCPRPSDFPTLLL